MLDSFKGKYVKVLISSGSGAGISGDVSRVYNSMITLFGTIKKSDAHFVELENTTMLYYPGINCSNEHSGVLTLDNIKQPLAFENPTSLININNIITISVIE